MVKTTITSADVAKRAQVSQSAVSRTFTNGASVSRATRAKVLTAAKELGYRPNALARSLISGKSGIIAILVAYLHNQFYPTVIEKLSRALQEKGFHTLLFMTDPGDQDSVIQQILQYQVEGVVMASAHLSSTLARECTTNGIPLVLFNRYIASSPASSVTADNIEGGRLAANHLVDQGFRRISFIAGYEGASTSRDREAGFYSALAERGLICHSRAVGAYRDDHAAQAVRDLMAADEPPDAIFVANDQMAYAVMDVLRNELSLTIPDDVAIIGFDNAPQSASGAYQLTTIEQPADEMVKATIDILLEQIGEKLPTRRAAVIPVSLIERATSTKSPVKN